MIDFILDNTSAILSRLPLPVKVNLSDRCVTGQLREHSKALARQVAEVARLPPRALRSTLLAAREPAPIRFPNRTLSDAFLLVLEDHELRENEARDLNIAQPGWGHGSSFVDEAWQTDDKQDFEIRM